MIFEEYFDKFYVINLPSRSDRLNSIRQELRRLGINVDSTKFTVPVAPILQDMAGFPTTGVRGNFLSHLANIEDACEQGFERILVLEDDAIFRSLLWNPAVQNYIAHSVEAYDWTMWFPGHHIKTHPWGSPKPIYQTTSAFKWAHCYAVHRRGLEALRDYLRLVCERPAGHPEGGKMYIDGALTHFRKQYTNHICLVSNPVLSVQKSSDTNLGSRQDANYAGSVRGIKSLARVAKDELWRRTGIRAGSAKLNRAMRGISA